MFIIKRLLPLAGGALAAGLLAGFLFTRFVRAYTTSAWLAPSILNLQKQGDLAIAPLSWNGNVDCYQEDFSNCVINTSYGSANTNASVRLANSTSYRSVISYIDNRQHFLAIPNSNTVITYTVEPPYGFYLYFNNNFSSSITISNPGTGTQYKINRAPDGKLTDKDNHRLAADYVSISFSENGKWMIVSEPNIAILRVNLQTFEVLPFAPGFNYTIGLNPAPQTAITNDGRYSVVASKDFNRFNIYDLSTCTAVPSTISGPVNCQGRDLQSLFTEQVSGFKSVGTMRFISDDTLSLYASYQQGTTLKNAKYLLSTQTGIIHQQDYLALGDSYISGEGAFQYLEGTDTSDSQCHVSLVSYPYLLGAELNYNSFHSVSCSGATTKDIIDTSNGYRGQVKPHANKQELDKSGRLPEILSNFQQGYIDQLDFVKQYQPKSITLSIGGNDIGFSSKLQSCLGAGTCYSSYEDRLEFVREVNRAFPKLVNTYTKLKTSGAIDARIYIIGYPQIAKPGGDCAINVHMNNDELIFAQQAIDYLDTVIKAATAKAGVFYVDTQDAFYGHRLCEAKPGSVAMNGVSAGNDFPDKFNGPIGRESYHPNELGHQLLENRILVATDNLTSSMPAVNLSSAPPTETGLEILDAPHSGRQINITAYDPSLLDDLVYRQVPTDVSIDGSVFNLSAISNLQSELHSSPVSLGIYKTDIYGNLSSQVTIPANVPAGYHTLHFYGNDLTGQPIDIYKEVYVAGTADDLDGNGITDSGQSCVGIPASGQDFDKDGIDDGCDANITQPPPLDSRGDQHFPTPSEKDTGFLDAPSSSGNEVVLSDKTVGAWVQDAEFIINPALQTSNQNVAVETNESNSFSTGEKVLAASKTNHDIPKDLSIINHPKLTNGYFEATGISLLIISSLVFSLRRRLF